MGKTISSSGAYEYHFGRWMECFERLGSKIFEYSINTRRLNLPSHVFRRGFYLFLIYLINDHYCWGYAGNITPRKWINDFLSGQMRGYWRHFTPIITQVKQIQFLPYSTMATFTKQCRQTTPASARVLWASGGCLSWVTRGGATSCHVEAESTNWQV